jgi:hypothetical protein
MRRTWVVIASVALGLALTTGVAGAASDYQQVLQVYEREGSVPPCQFTPAQLQSALGGVDTYGAQYFADFTQAVQAALTSQAGGACAVVTSTGRRGAGPAGGSGRSVPPPPAVALTAASSAGLPLPLKLLGGLTLAGALALGGGATVARLRRRRAQRVTGAPRL